MDSNLREQPKLAKWREEKWQHWADAYVQEAQHACLKNILFGESAYNVWNNRKCGITENEVH